MRLTCLKCGHQIELATASQGVRVACVCGRDYTYPDVVNTGIQPNEKAAERSRYRAFRAAGVVQNVGGFALGIALLGIIFFPFAIVGAGIGVYVLTMLRGPVGRYSGRPQAVVAVALGVIVFLGGGGLWLRWYHHRQQQKLVTLQEGAREDLKRLLRAERLFKATNDRFGGFSEFKFQPSAGQYTIYLGANDVFAGDEDLAAELPADLSPGFSEDSFVAIAVANLDGDAELDVWLLSDAQGVQHLRDDLDGEGLPLTSPPPPATEPAPEPSGAPPGDGPGASGPAAGPHTPPPTAAPASPSTAWPKEPVPTPAPATDSVVPKAPTATGASAPATAPPAAEPAPTQPPGAPPSIPTPEPE